MGKAKKRKKMSWKEQVFLLFLFITAVVFVPTTIMLTIGMLPTIVASFVDRSKERMMGLTVGAMNLAGCTPFVLQLWTGTHSVAGTMEIIGRPLTLMVMYFAAAVGYMIEWSMTGMVVIFMTEKAKSRLEDIDRQHQDLVRRWGPEVTGTIKLGEDGFPLERQFEAAGGSAENEESGREE